ncbi:Peptide methionine sulfoxide reductase (Fragment) [Linum perenne]
MKQLALLHFIFLHLFSFSFSFSNSQFLQMTTNANSSNPAMDPDLDQPDNPTHQFAQFGGGCFWGVELAFQRLPGVVKTEVGYSQGNVPDPNYKLICTGTTNHVEVVRGNDAGTQYRSGIYFYNENQARLTQESKEAKQLELKDKKIVTEILPAKRFYRAEEYHQQYLEKGGGRGSKQSAAKGCNDPIRCYG